MKFYTSSDYGKKSAQDRAEEKRKVAELLVLRGTVRVPDSPREVVAQPGARKAVISWSIPERVFDVVGYRIYKGTESNLVEEISDKYRTRTYIPLSSGASPEVVPVFVSAMSASRESVLIQVNATCLAEAGAPVDPTPPPPPPPGVGGGGRVRRGPGKELNPYN